MPTPPKKHYVRLTFGEKVKLCSVAAMQSFTLERLSEWATRAFDLPKPPALSTIHAILSSRDTLLKLSPATHARKKAGDPVVAEFEAAVAAEFDMMEKAVKTVNDASVIVLARHMADLRQLPVNKRPSFSKGWLHRFKRRWGIKSKKKHGEAASVDPAAVRTGRVDMRKFTDHYAMSDIYNMDETSFYYQEEAPSTLSRQSAVAGYKAKKTRLTLCVACNADGSDKLPLFFIGKTAAPRDLKGRDLNTLGVEYANTKKAWMNSMSFLNWLHSLDLRMQREGRHILLLVDNVSSHVRPLRLLANVRLEFLPPNTTSVLQPLDQGIIYCIKRRFHSIKIDTSVRRYLQQLPQEKITIFAAMQWAKLAWDAVGAETIRNCWNHTGILSDRMKIDYILG